MSSDSPPDTIELPVFKPFRTCKQCHSLMGGFRVCEGRGANNRSKRGMICQTCSSSGCHWTEYHGVEGTHVYDYTELLTLLEGLPNRFTIPSGLHSHTPSPSAFAEPTISSSSPTPSLPIVIRQSGSKLPAATQAGSSTRLAQPLSQHWAKEYERAQADKAQILSQKLQRQKDDQLQQQSIELWVWTTKGEEPEILAHHANDFPRFSFSDVGILGLTKERYVDVYESGRFKTYTADHRIIAIRGRPILACVRPITLERLKVDDCPGLADAMAQQRPLPSHDIGKKRAAEAVVSPIKVPKLTGNSDAASVVHCARSPSVELLPDIHPIRNKPRKSQKASHKMSNTCPLARTFPCDFSVCELQELFDKVAQKMDDDSELTLERAFEAVFATPFVKATVMKYRRFWRAARTPGDFRDLWQEYVNAGKHNPKATATHFAAIAAVRFPNKKKLVLLDDEPSEARVEVPSQATSLLPSSSAPMPAQHSPTIKLEQEDIRLVTHTFKADEWFVDEYGNMELID
ncbi:hypothetical protein PUNSTDRAFT_46159 [Punctularia strigosozonata HHB-11173 SS5]|uniref:uncharacterized protein n=1 Tax=Punctularia strigosozonata (strain HHB-11173) TaxID=741275 RepID=UPI000441727A|nr:uncharacterized protein PUNSTDRAFT_46159 [Punctularia strigosozonata HHB-11173 SS5]EIN06763.1 hypothetical protein PUNSTDRAFT_46159 [Punctularia strigosozonata HHB-11173 SS5]